MFLSVSKYLPPNAVHYLKDCTWKNKDAEQQKDKISQENKLSFTEIKIAHEII